MNAMRVDGTNLAVNVLGLWRCGRTSSCTNAVPDNGYAIAAVDVSEELPMNPRIKNGQKFSSVVQVRKERVRTYVDEKLVADLKTTYAGLKLPDEQKLKDVGALGLYEQLHGVLPRRGRRSKRSGLRLPLATTPPEQHSTHNPRVVQSHLVVSA